MTTFLTFLNDGDGSRYHRGAQVCLSLVPAQDLPGAAPSKCALQCRLDQREASVDQGESPRNMA